MSDFVLDITVEQRAFGIIASIHPRSEQHSVRGKSTTRLFVLIIIIVKGTTTNVVEVALNQGIVIGRNIICWLPENSIDVHCTGHDRTTIVNNVATGAACSRDIRTLR